MIIRGHRLASLIAKPRKDRTAEETAILCEIFGSDHYVAADSSTIARREAEITEAVQRYQEIVEPSLAEQLRNYKDALLRWRQAGYPTRSDEEVAAILKICRGGCEVWNPKGWCKECGCYVNESRVAPLNKARMGSEKCPKGKWGN